MAPYYKYEVIYTRQPNGKEQRYLIQFGKLKPANGSKSRSPIVTPYTYAFRVFSSQLNINDMADDIDNSFEFKHSVMHYIGEAYSVDTFYAMYPEDEIFIRDDLATIKHVIAVACLAGDQQDKKAYVVNKWDPYRIVTYPEVNNTYVHCGTNQLNIHYRACEI
ncbi:MAG: hypothetical protein MJ246_07945 [Clostridia bacterium]|nr:hypothetical protein [Clostridia bacterium]